MFMVFEAENLLLRLALNMFSEVLYARCGYGYILKYVIANSLEIVTGRNYNYNFHILSEPVSKTSDCLCDAK